MNNPPPPVHLDPSSDSTDYPGDIDCDVVSSQFNKDGDGWSVTFNPEVKHQVDINLIHTLMDEGIVQCVAFSKDGKYLVTGGNRTARIYNTDTGQKICVFAHTDTDKLDRMLVYCARFSPNGKYLATGGDDNRIRIWDISEKCIYKVFDEHQQAVISLDFSPNGRLVASSSGERLVKIWDTVDDTSRVLSINDYDSLDDKEEVLSVAISPNGQYVASGSCNSAVRIWDIHTGQLLERLCGNTRSVLGVAFTPDGKGLVSGTNESTLKCWDISALGGGADAVKRAGRDRKRSRKGCPCTMSFTGDKIDFFSVAVSYDGKWVVAGSVGVRVHLWDARNMTMQFTLAAHPSTFTSVALSRSGNLLATGTYEGRVRIWNILPLCDSPN